MAGWREEAMRRGPRRDRGNVAAVLLDRVSNAGTTPHRPSPFGLPFFGCRASLPKPAKTAEGMVRLRRLTRQPNSRQRHPPFSVSRPYPPFARMACARHGGQRQSRSGATTDNGGRSSHQHLSLPACAPQVKLAPQTEHCFVRAPSPLIAPQETLRKALSGPFQSHRSG